MNFVPLIKIIVAVLVVGTVVWGLDQLPAIDATFKQVARVLLIVGLVIWAIFVLAGMFGYAWG